MDQALEQKVVGAAAGVLAAVHQPTHLVKGLLVNKGLVGALHHNPVLGLLADALLGLVVDLPAASLHHVADISLVLQHIRDPLTGPQAGVWAGLAHREPRISCGRWDVLLVEPGGDLPAAHAGESHTEDPAHHRGDRFVDDDFVFLGGVHLVAVDRFSADEQPLALLVVLDAGDLFGDILGVHVVHDGAEGGDVVGSGVHPGVDAVQQGDIPHPVFGEVPLHVVAGENVVAAQTAQILGDDHVDLLGLDVGDQPLKIRSVKIGAAPAVIHIGVKDAQAVLLDEFLQHGSLVVDAFRWSFVLILL